MSGSYSLTITGGWSGHAGQIVTIPSSVLFGDPTAQGDINKLLQDYLFSIGQAVVGETYNFENLDVTGGEDVIIAGTVSGSPSAADLYGAGTPTGGTFEEITNTDSVGGTTSGSGNYQATVTSGVTDLMVQLPGNLTLAGEGAVTHAIFGANSNVNYTVTNPGAGSYYLAGGANSVTFYSAGTANAETVYSAGTDTVDMSGGGTDYATVMGNATLQDEAANAYVVAEGNATANFYFNDANAGGTLHFTNASTAQAFIHIGNFGGVTSTTKVTVDGGAGGGFFVGGASGSNSLVGGTGAVTLVGAGGGDFLEAQSSGDNVLAQGDGFETLIATSTTGSNVFGAGLAYPGLGNPPASGIISTEGSGTQQYLIGNVPGGESIYGSTFATLNNYFIDSGTINGGTIGGGLISIYNFIDSRSTILFENGAGGASPATITAAGFDNLTNTYDVVLSDGTTVLLKGLNQSEVNAIHTVNAFGITGIQG